MAIDGAMTISTSCISRIVRAPSAAIDWRRAPTRFWVPFVVSAGPNRICSSGRRSPIRIRVPRRSVGEGARSSCGPRIANGPRGKAARAGVGADGGDGADRVHGVSRSGFGGVYGTRPRAMEARAERPSRGALSRGVGASPQSAPQSRLRFDGAEGPRLASATRTPHPIRAGHRRGTAYSKPDRVAPPIRTAQPRAVSFRGYPSGGLRVRVTTTHRIGQCADPPDPERGVRSEPVAGRTVSRPIRAPAPIDPQVLPNAMNDARAVTVMLQMRGDPVAVVQSKAPNKELSKAKRRARSRPS